MKTIIAGSRGIPKLVTIRAIASCPWAITEVVSGTARGADTHGEEWARDNGIPVVRMPADWSKGRGAGHTRNAEMADAAQGLVAAWDGHSLGTRNMIETAKRKGLQVHVVTPSDREHIDAWLQTILMC